MAWHDTVPLPLDKAPLISCLMYLVCTVHSFVFALQFVCCVALIGLHLKIYIVLFIYIVCVFFLCVFIFIVFITKKEHRTVQILDRGF